MATDLADVKAQMIRDYGPDVAPEEILLAAASDEVLLTAFAALTHRLSNPTPREDQIRAERDLLHAEILRRMGDPR
jgi:hypothetical protein